MKQDVPYLKLTESKELNTFPPTPKFVGLRQICDGWIKKYEVEYERPDGSRFHFDSASRKNAEDYLRFLEASTNEQNSGADAVCIIPQLPNGNLVLIQEFRYPLNSWCIAFPAGIIENGEDYYTSANRELGEEIGCAIRKDLPREEAFRTLSAPSFTGPGFTDETNMLCFCQVEYIGKQHLDETEVIRPVVLEIPKIEKFFEENKLIIGVRTHLVLKDLMDVYNATTK